jgi:predicted DNA-binding transcriptional regulator AlpA
MHNSANVLNVVETAQKLGIGRRAVVDLIRTHQLPAKKLPGRTGAYVLAPEDVEAYREANLGDDDEQAKASA